MHLSGLHPNTMSRFSGHPLSPPQYWKQLPLVRRQLTFLYELYGLFPYQGGLTETNTQGEQREPKTFSITFIPVSHFPAAFGVPLTLGIKGLVVSIFVSMVSSSEPRTKVYSKELLVV